MRGQTFVIGELVCWQSFDDLAIVLDRHVMQVGGKRVWLSVLTSEGLKSMPENWFTRPPPAPAP